MANVESTDLRIRISGTGQDFHVEAALDDGSQFQGETIHIDEEEKQRLLSDPAGSGDLLGKQLFTGQIQQAFLRGLMLGEQRQTRLRVQLWISDEAWELQALPWERIIAETPGGPITLAASARTAFSRYSSLCSAEPTPVFARPVRLLFAVANPEGVEPIAVEQEVSDFANLVAQIDDLQVTIAAGRTPLSSTLKADLACRRIRLIEGPLTLNALQHAAQGQHLIHLLAHGNYRKAKQLSELFLEEETGQASITPDTELVRIFTAQAEAPRLIFLASCETAVHSDKVALAVSLGPKLVREGIPAVVAMQAKVPMQAAQRLTVDFYRDLLCHGMVDHAMSAARSFLFDRNNVNWAIPVLFHRIRSGRLFQADLRLGLRKLLNEPDFKTRPDGLAANLEAVLLPASQITANWEHTAAQTRSRVNLQDQTLLLPNLAAKAKVPFYFAVAGPRGIGKSTYLRSFAAETAKQSLESRDVFPLYVDLENYVGSKPGRLGKLESLMLEIFRSYSGPQAVDESYFRNLLATANPRMRVIFDNGDDLPEPVRTRILADIDTLVERYPQTEFWLGMEQGCWNIAASKVSYLLAAQLLTRTSVETYLSTHGLTTLADKLAEAQIWDLAALPWSLDQIVRDAQRGSLPERRLDVLHRMVEDQLAVLPRAQQPDARRGLRALARIMQLDRRSSLPIDQVSRILREIRGAREYSIDRLIDDLMLAQLLRREGEDSIRFSYQCLQSYFCAESFADAIGKVELQDIAATLGRLGHLHWWEDTLLLYAGLTDSPELLELIIFGSNLREGDQVFLAARCLLEAKKRALAGDMADHVLDALIWRANILNEPRVAKRVLAVRSLAQMDRPEIVPVLARLTSQKVKSPQGRLEFEYAQVRQAAFRGLRRLPESLRATLQNGYPTLAQIIRHSKAQDIAALKTGVLGADSALAGVSAFALGEFARCNEEARQALIATVLDPAEEVPTAWAAADTLVTLNPQRIEADVIAPFLDGAVPAIPDVMNRLIYIAGELGSVSDRTISWLEVFLQQEAPSMRKGRAMIALGSLRIERWRETLESVVATGDLKAIAAEANEKDSIYLRRKALEALAFLGNLQTLERLRAALRRDNWPSDLERTYYSTSEEILLRTSTLKGA